MSTLYLVATPIGNLADITLRAIETLKSVSLIAAEDTRVTKKLLNRYQIHNQIISLYAQTETRRIPAILEALEQGDVALVSDSGTPAFNDPGYQLVKAVIQAGHRVSPIPGPCAPIAALVASGLPTDRFIYLGFLPRRANDLKLLVEKISALPYTMIVLEAPHRLLRTLTLLHQHFGSRTIVIAREITKYYEEFWRGTIPQAITHFSANEPRGEITMIIAGIQQSNQKWDESKLIKAILQRVRTGTNLKNLSLDLAKESGWQSKEIYQRAVKVKSGLESEDPS